MNTRRGYLLLGLVIMLVAGAAAGEAVNDTTYVLGGPDRWDGRFEDPDGQPNWHGWTHADLYNGNDERHWHVSDHLPIAGQYSLWCGTWFENDCVDGYGNGWFEGAAFVRTAADPDAPTSVRWQATISVDSEPGYDYLHVQARRGTDYVDLVVPAMDGRRDLILDETITFAPEDYLEGNWELRFFAVSDAAWSDEDCLWDTHGLARVDDITVTVDGEVVSHEDFESGATEDWLALSLPLVGDFSKLWSGLDDLDPLHQNDSWQVAFVDDGVVVPGTGGTPCYEWCYGPDGWVLNVTAGLNGHGVDGSPLGWWNGGVWNGVMSPVLAWPDDFARGELAFDVYAHMFNYSCGVTVYGWTVRATAAADPAELNMADWAPTRWSLFNEVDMPTGPGYFRIRGDLGELLPPAARWIQVRLEVHEGGPWCWGPYVSDASPAPYFDNVAVSAWRTTTGVPDAPTELSLAGAPNPFNPRVVVSWSQPTEGPVDLTIFDARGRRVRRLLRGEQPAGRGETTWDGRDDMGRPLPGGVYLARLQTAAGTERLKLTLAK